jgi:MSHA pilin protein MshD
MSTKCSGGAAPGQARHERGVTLIELILFMLVVSVALVGVLQALRVTTAGNADPVRRKQALMIAEGLLEEVQLAKFDFCEAAPPDPDPAATPIPPCTIRQFGQRGDGPVRERPYDNVIDYVDAANVPRAAFNDAAGVLTDAAGVPMAVSGYTAILTVSPQSLGNIGSGGTSADVDALRISVEVSYDDQKVVLDGFRTRYARQEP